MTLLSRITKPENSQKSDSNQRSKFNKKILWITACSSIAVLGAFLAFILVFWSFISSPNGEGLILSNLPFLSANQKNQLGFSKDLQSYIDEQQIPENKFLIINLGTNFTNQNKIIDTEIKDSLKLQKPSSEKVKMVAVGDFVFEKDQAKQINLDMYGWGAVYINGEQIMQGQHGQATVLYQFRLGKNRVLVEYSSDNQNIKLDMAEPISFANTNRLNIEIPELQESELFYVGRYQGGDNFKSQIFLQPSQKPIVLFLSSYEAID